MSDSIWATANCPVCGLPYKYLVDSLYRPPTCSQYDCVHAFVHHPQCQDLLQMLDAERLKAFRGSVEVGNDV